MAGMQFQFDEKGGTFYYFLLSFMALVLFPITYYLWPKKNAKENQDIGKNQCQCEPCLLKRKCLLASRPWKKAKSRAIKLIIILSWVAFALVAYKASQVEIDYKEFDPYAELEIDRGATTPEIRRAYRRLSMIYHPDKETGDSVRFMRITKAHAALTDDEARENWEKYGNPDGPGATHFGIALPQWIVEKQNSMWVLAVYALVFMVIMPVIVGTWWYRSIKYSAELILMDTTRLYYVFLQKTPNMIIRRVVMVLAGSFEFSKNHNNEVVQRPSDNEDLPRLMKDLTNLGEKNKETPLCWPFSVKARALIHAHFSRLDSLPDTLKQDQSYILAKCPYLLNEMINMAAQLVAMAHSGRGHMPRLETVENMMKVSQMVVQALWESKSPLLQLPHITEDLLRHFVTKRRSIKSIEQFLRLKEDERRLLLRSLGDHEYRDVMIVCRNLPHVTLNVCSEVLDDEDSSITAGSIVTVTVNLVRIATGDLYGHEEVGDHKPPAEDDDQPGVEEEEEETEQPSGAPTQRKLKVWEKQKKKKGGKTAKSKKKQAVKQVQQAKKPASPQQHAAESKEGEAAESAQGTPNGMVQKVERKSKRRNDEAGSTDDEAGTGSEEEGEAEASPGGAERVDDDDDDSWEKFQKQSKKDGMLETKSKETHVVHSPYFPSEKYEWWWLYVADKKSRLLITAPVQVCSLRTEEQVEMKFSAPKKPGIYTYTVILRSDSFVDLDKTHNIKLDVKEARAIENVKQWDFSDDEEDKADDEESDGTTDEDATDED